MELERPGGIPSVQAFLLLGDLECGIGRDNTGWMYAGELRGNTMWAVEMWLTKEQEWQTGCVLTSVFISIVRMMVLRRRRFKFGT
jgi:hypothetical protein